MGMLFSARIYKDGKFWLAEIEALDAMTQGRTKKEAMKMLKDWIRSSLDDSKVCVVMHELSSEEYAVLTEDSTGMIALLLQRQRLKAGLTIRQLSDRLGYRSHTAYAQYEQGKSEPSLTQLNRFLEAMRPGQRAHLKIS